MKNKEGNLSGKLSILLLTGLYIVWAGLFIYRSSYLALDGQRYFGLFDDAMISMRYAWNFAHGLGLVWNAGQRVEGYSNLLMTLVMSLAALFLEKKFAVLAVQIFGLFTVLGIATVTKQIANEINDGKPYRELLGLLAFACVLFYYPLSYWALMGMETGLLTILVMASILFALRWLKTNENRDLTYVAIMAGLAFLARNDSIILSALVFAYLGFETYKNKKDKKTTLKILYAGCLFALFPIAQTAFRYFYYGQLLPNTYILKLTGIPLSVRVIGGYHFLQPFFQQSILVIIIALIGVLLEPRLVKAFLFSLIVAAVGYQIYVGGDPWQLWRMLAPAMPALFILAIRAGADIALRIPQPALQKYLAVPLVLIAALVPLALTDLPFLSDMSVRGPTSAAIANHVNTNTALALNKLTSPEASIGVIWAGTLPYYTDRKGVDFLGKSDPYIAHLKPDLSGAVSWAGELSVPGHNKYDLNYSIEELQPTYIQAFSWGDQTVKPWVVLNYVRVEYHGATETKTLFLLKDSPYVCWELCKNNYKIIPWPKEKKANP
jgi:arabinofuranosyltransferase